MEVKCPWNTTSCALFADCLHGKLVQRAGTPQSLQDIFDLLYYHVHNVAVKREVNPI